MTIHQDKPRYYVHLLRGLVFATLVVCSYGLAQRSLPFLMPATPLQPSGSPAVAAAATPPNAPPSRHTQPSAQCSPVSSPNVSVSAEGRAPGLHVIRENPRYYAVYGYSTAQIRQQMQSCGPLLSDSKRYAASTAYSINWRYMQTPLNSEPGVCTLEKPVVVIRTQQTLPSWQKQGTDLSVINAWGDFIGNLRHHENGHTDRNVAAAQRIFNRMSAQEPVSCAHMSAHVTTLINAELVSLKRDNAQYDHATNHGITQGSVL